MPTTTFNVSGMSCGHCASSVTEELSELGGVRDVDVAVETGEVTVTSDRDLTRDEVAAAIDEAGYQLV